MDDKTLQECRALGGDLLKLWMEAACVVGLRSLRLARGGAKAAAEARLMVDEKIVAHQRFATAVVSGKHGASPLGVARAATRFYLHGVRANRRRLLAG